MSDTEGRRGAPLSELEGLVDEAVGRLGTLRRRVRAAEGKSQELEALVQRFTGDPDEPARLLSRLERLESENADLRRRLDEGREAVDRMIARIRFLERQQ